MFDRFFAFVDRWVLRIERPRSSLLLFAALAALLVLQLWPAAWIGNEEHYLQLPYRAFAPEKFSPFHAASVDESRARFVPLYLLGSTVELLPPSEPSAALQAGRTQP